EVQHLARGALAGFHVEGRAGADRGVNATSLPSGGRVIDARVHPLRVKTVRIGHAKHDELSVLQRQKSLGSIPGVDRRVLAETERVELIDPRVVTAFGTARIGHALQLRERLRTHRPAFWALLTCGLGSVERSFALAAIETSVMSARERHPVHAVAI